MIIASKMYISDSALYLCVKHDEEIKGDKYLVPPPVKRKHTRHNLNPVSLV